MVSKIAVDVDGVLIDLMSRFYEMYNKKYGTCFIRTDHISYDFWKDWGVSKESIFDIFSILKDDYQSIPIIDNNAKYIMKYLNDRFHVDILTITPIKYFKKLENKLISMGIKQKTHYNELIMIPYNPNTLKIEFPYNIFIDDNPNLVKAILNSKKDKKILLYDQPWNKNIKDNEKVYRVMSWEDIYHTINYLIDWGVLNDRFN